MLVVLLLLVSNVFAQCNNSSENTETARGVVFTDLNRDGLRGYGEAGVERVSVSNGCDIVLTNVDGAYEISLSPGQILFISQPSGYVVPVDQNNLPQFYYSQ